MNEGDHRTMLGRHLNRLLATTALAVVLVACGGESGNDADGADEVDVTFEDLTGQDEVVIQVRDNSFVPQHVEVSAGASLTFDNRGRNPHNAVPVEDGAFAEVATESLQPGQAATVVFDEPGEFPYYCTLHGTDTAGMVGTIRVVD
jgi:plastocyanin